jgi:hypothetical protein
VGFAPTLLVNAACLGLVLVSLLLVLLMARLLLATSGPTASLLAVGHGAFALLALAGAIGVRSGRSPLAILGLLACPIAGLASLFALLTGSIAGLGGGATALVTFVLVLLALRDVARMGAARAALRLVSSTPEPGPPSGPLSADLPRVTPRRWPVLLVLALVAVLGGGGVAIGLHYGARAERATEAAAFKALEGCLLGGTPAPGVAPSVAYRRMEIELAVAPPSANAWPARCAAHAHALHESKRRSGTHEQQGGTALHAERLGRLLSDPRGGSVYEAVDQLWAVAADEGYEPTPSEDGATPPSWLDVDALAQVDPFSKTRLPLGALSSDRVASPALHVLVDGARQPGEGRLCTLEPPTLRCTALAPPLADGALALGGGAEAGAEPLLFARSGQAGIFRPNGQAIAELASYGGVARADGSVGVVGYDRGSSKFVLLRAEKEGEPTRATFPLPGVTDDRQVALLDDNLVWATDDGILSTARILPSGAPLGVATELGTIASVRSFEACRSRDAFFVVAKGAARSALAIDTGDRWSSLIPTRGGSLSCAGKEAFLLRQQVRAGGSGSISLERCTAGGCQAHSLDLDDVFQHNVELLPKRAPLALALNGKLLLVWSAGQRGGVRMRLAPIEHIAAAEDVVVFDDRLENASVSPRSNLLEIRGWVQEERALLFLGTTAGVWALAIDDGGKITPIETRDEPATTTGPP